eukprot:gene6248-277_t
MMTNQSTSPQPQVSCMETSTVTETDQTNSLESVSSNPDHAASTSGTTNDNNKQTSSVQPSTQGRLATSEPSQETTNGLAVNEALPDLPSDSNVNVANTHSKSHSRTRFSNREAEIDAMKRRVFVGNIGRQCSEEDIRELIGNRFGNILTINIIRDHGTHTSKGYGFISFASEQEAERCIQLAERQPVFFQGRQFNFRVARRRERGASDPPRRRVTRRTRLSSLDGALSQYYPRGYPHDGNGSTMSPLDIHYDTNVMSMYMPMQPSYLPNGRMMPQTLHGYPATPNGTPYNVYHHPLHFGQTEFTFPAPNYVPSFIPEQHMYPAPCFAYNQETTANASIDDASKAIAALSLSNETSSYPASY